jgi:DNA adenine methylase
LAPERRLPEETPSDPERPLSRGTASILSPLRYPGGKKRLAGYIAEILRLNRLRPRLFVEPFAGGASVALQLLNDGLVDSIALGEKDPLVAAFWQTVFHDHEWLIRRLRETEPTLENWDRFKRGNFNSTRWRALACIFLNRTSFSGILAPGAGPIGGRAQTSEYKIGCRFDADVLAKRIRMAARLAGRVAFVQEGNWNETVRRVRARRFRAGEVVYYLDPPFYYKAGLLYRHSFDDTGHKSLHDALPTLGQHWILSYDPAEPILKLYTRNGIGPKRVELLYSATAAGAPLKSQELIITNLPKLPSETRLWRTAAEWR